MVLKTPVRKQTSTTATSTLRLGLWTSSDKVVTPSKPMYVSAARDVAVATAFRSKVSGL